MNVHAGESTARRATVAGSSKIGMKRTLHAMAKMSQRFTFV